MFNRSYYQLGPSHTSVNTTVTEKRAPTDESVRLLKEMEDAARKKITETTTVHNTEFTCKLHKYYDGLNDSEKYSVIYTLNGKQSRVDVDVEFYKMLSPEEVACFIRDKVAFDIANKMIHTAFRDINKWNFFKSGEINE
jgi:negative regulator of sigma E activity